MRRVLKFDGPRRGSDEEAWEHRATVTLEPADVTAPAWLQVDGVATVYDVLVNGTVVVEGVSMFARHQVEVAALLREGDNEVLVRSRPLPLDDVPRRPRARWRTTLVEDPRLRWVRTSLLGRAPGFAPGPPVVGPWRPMVLETRQRHRLLALDLRCTAVDDAAGLLEASVVVGGDAPARLDVAITGPGVDVVAPVPLHEGRGEVRIELAQVERWWPHTHGTPTLYDVRLRADGVELTDRRVGFRTIENAAPDALDLRVNDVAVFVRGAVWTPGDLTALEEAVSLGLNLVRISGVTAYESDEFHRRCDELGLLVWQDLMFATLDYPLADEDFVAAVTSEVTAECRQLLGHPSTAVVCGSAEHEQQAAMYGVEPGPERELARFLRPLVAGSGLDTIWVDSTPCGGTPPIRVDTGIAQYFGVGAYLREPSDVRAAGVRFAAECLAFSNLPDGAPDRLSDGVPHDSGADWDFGDVRRHYLRRRYGAAATDDEARRVTGEVMADVFAEWRRPGSPCRGGIVLWLRDLVPGAGWGLLDHRGRPKPAARELARVLQPTAMWILDERFSGLDVHLAHDAPAPLAGDLVVRLLRADGSVAETVSRRVGVPGHGHLVLGVEELLGRWVDIGHAYRFGPPSYDAVDVTLTTPEVERIATWRRTG